MSDATTSPLPDQSSRSPRPPLPRWTVPVVAVVALAAAGLTLLVLWWWIDGLALSDPDRKAAAQLDAVKTASGIAVGGGGLFALYLAARRQRTQELELAQRERVQIHAEQVAEVNRVHAERVAEASQKDAADRRVTELYTKASEQLGSDKAPVRLAGLYALERLAQDNPHQRQTVVNVLCAYLRMPYALAGDPPADNADEPTRTRHAHRVQEREVRLTAQHILADHLRPGPDPRHPVETFWPDTDLNLTGATLIDLDFAHCQLHHALFDEATFTRDARFFEATFTESARFDKATFTGTALFDKATFAKDAVFDEATFTKEAFFGATTFAAFAGFGKATFAGHTWFREAIFTGHAWFREATCTGAALFDTAIARHPVQHSVWPAGWRITDDHQPVYGRDGTWYRLIEDEAVPGASPLRMP